MTIVDYIFETNQFVTLYKEASNDVTKVTRFWNTCNPEPAVMINKGDIYNLRESLFRLLEACRQIDGDAFVSIHKGHPYYFIGICSFLLKDFQTAVYFIDGSVTEDISKNEAHPYTNPKPSTMFLMLQGDQIGQAARLLVIESEAVVEEIIREYHSLMNAANYSLLSIEDLRLFFISYSLCRDNDPGLRTLVTALISFCLEWKYRLGHFKYGVSGGSYEPFFTHLFRGCQLFESLLKLNPRIEVDRRNTLGVILNDRNVRDSLQINVIKRNNVDFSNVLDRLNNDETDITELLQRTYYARNTLGHNLGWGNQITEVQYRALFCAIACSCFHVIAKLYKPAT